MKIRRREPLKNCFNKADWHGRSLEMWLSGVAGAMITTLPVFIFMPFWFWFIHYHEIVYDTELDNYHGRNGDISALGCASFGFSFGIVVWMILIFGFSK